MATEIIIALCMAIAAFLNAPIQRIVMLGFLLIWCAIKNSDFY